MPDFNPFNIPEFREELSKMLDEKLAPLADLKKKVDDHEATLQRSKGAIATLAALWTLFLGVAEYLFHRHSS